MVAAVSPREAIDKSPLSGAVGASPNIPDACTAFRERLGSGQHIPPASRFALSVGANESVDCHCTSAFSFFSSGDRRFFVAGPLEFPSIRSIPFARNFCASIVLSFAHGNESAKLLTASS